MKIPMFENSKSGRPLVLETFICPDGHLGTYTTEVLEDHGTYYQVLECEYAPYHGPKQDLTLPDLDSVMREFFGCPF
jgi:hypothetical protein